MHIFSYQPFVTGKLNRRMSGSSNNKIYMVWLKRDLKKRTEAASGQPLCSPFSKPGIQISLTAGSKRCQIDTFSDTMNTSVHHGRIGADKRDPLTQR